MQDREISNRKKPEAVFMHFFNSMTTQSPLEVEPVSKKEEKRDDPDTEERMQKLVDDRLYVLRRAASHNPMFRLSLNDRFFFMVNGYNIRLNIDKSKNFEREVKLVPYGQTAINENRSDLKYSQHNPTKNYKDNLSRPDWKCFGGTGEK